MRKTSEVLKKSHESDEEEEIYDDYGSDDESYGDESEDDEKEELEFENDYDDNRNQADEDGAEYQRSPRVQKSLNRVGSSKTTSSSLKS